MNKTTDTQHPTDEASKAYLETSGTVKQGRRPMYKSFKQERDEYKTHADKLAEELKRLSVRVLQSDFYQHAKDETDNAIAAFRAYEEAK